MLALPMMSSPLMLFQLMRSPLLTMSKVPFREIGAVILYISVFLFIFVMHCILLAPFYLLSDTFSRLVGRPHDGQDRAGL